jgi:heparosan-N-sulfate-glucuronate 5-epimerase
MKRDKLKVLSLTFYGSGNAANISLSDAEELRMFLDGAKWFLENQDEQGGWSSNVVFNQGRKKYPKAAEIQPGWYGAMCQGQAISVLCRAYHVTGDRRYLQAAEAALGPFQLDVADGGVRAVFLDRYSWYEEYPTTPSTFILNGFIYSLIGLYDLQTINPHNEPVQILFQKGIESLLALLPLYDAGSATFYDLRHFTMQTAPKVARWDYHSTHINQLLLLSTIHNNSLLKDTAERWRGYMVGKRAPHN